MKSRDELKKLAIDVVDGKVFTDRHLVEHQKHMIGQVFMPIGLGAFSKKTKEEIYEIGMVYEYYSKAGPSTVNGLPVFFSLVVLNKEETDEMIKQHGIYTALKKEFKDN